MSLTPRTRPSAAMILACVALSFALAGSAIAGTDALTRAVSKSKVKKIAKKQANKAIDAAEPGLNVNSANTADNATNATNADNADTVDGVSAAGIDYRSGASAAETTILDLGGLRMVASCPAGELTLLARTTIDDSVLRGFGKNVFNTPGVENDVRSTGFSVGDDEDLVFDDNDDHVQFLEFSGGPGTSGSNVSVQYTVQNDTNSCAVTGHALQSE
jgi:hypothetical protein